MTDEQGRIFGKISIVDIFAVLAIILIAASVYIRINNSGAKTLAVAYSTQYQYTVVAEELPQHTVDALYKSVGTDLFSHGEKIGTLEKIVSVDPVMWPINQPNGEVFSVQHPGKFNVRMSVKCNGTKVHAGTLAEGNRVISNNAMLELETKYTLVNGTVKSVHKIK